MSQSSPDPKHDSDPKDSSPSRTMNTVKETAVKLNLGLTSVYKLLNTGQLCCHRIGPRNGKILISDEEIQAYLTRHSKGGSKNNPYVLKHFKFKGS